LVLLEQLEPAAAAAITAPSVSASVSAPASASVSAPDVGAPSASPAAAVTTVNEREEAEGAMLPLPVGAASDARL
jgi:hypothetical protein